MIATALLAIGFVLLIEGLAYALAPSLVERLLLALSQLPLPARRNMGLLGMIAGVALLWLAKTLGA